MPRKAPAEEERARLREAMDNMIKARIEMFADNSERYARALGKFRGALVKSGFNKDEAMQIVLKVAETNAGRPRFMGWHPGHLHKR
jgi:hypothetical protein